VKDRQTVKPNAKYTCTAKRFHVTDMLKPSEPELEFQLNQTKPNLDKTPIEPNPTLTEPKLDFC